MIDIDALEEQAKAAGGLPWEEDGYIIFEDMPGGDVVGRVNVASALCGEVADFMAAANPATILALIAEVRALREDAGSQGVRIERYSIPESGIEIIRADQRTGPAKWKVFKDGYCLSKFGGWEYEPMPSSRTDDFIERCRFDSAKEAIDAARGAK